jgi:hypothetical protein
MKTTSINILYGLVSVFNRWDICYCDHYPVLMGIASRYWIGKGIFERYKSHLEKIILNGVRPSGRWEKLLVQTLYAIVY